VATAAPIVALLGALAPTVPAPLFGPTVHVDGCTDLSGPRIAELLAVEHAELSKVTSLRVELTCHANEVVIAVDDGLTGKRLERTVDAPAAGMPGRDREIALATSSLIVASYLELFAPRERVNPPLPPPTPETAAAERVVARALDVTPRATLQGTAGLRLRSLPELLAVPHVGLRLGGYAGRRWEPFGHVAFELGLAARDLGRVMVLGAWLGGGAAWHLRPHAPIGLQLFAAVAGGYVRLEGRSTRPDVQPDVVDGVTAEAELGLGPELRVGTFIAGLDVRGGYTLANPRGRVAGEAAVTPGGPWVGLGLRLGGVFGQPSVHGRQSRARTPAR
jgi:hypothetical protein